MNLAAQVWLYRRRRVRRGERVRSGRTALRVAGFAGLAVLMAAVAAGAHRLCPGPEVARLAVGVASGAAVYGGLAWALGLQEPRWLLARA
ncbi:MAG: hypothetical protein D6731_08890 [Planctomycetota bacterium]|nr:MAG: hypothetical protein D6731_08890 [Planctomycetota bacterium]